MDRWLNISPKLYKSPLQGETVQIQEEFILLILHAAGIFFIAGFVIIAQEVKKAVNHEKLKGFLETVAGGFSFTQRFFYGNDNISQQQGIDIAVITFGHGKGDDVSRIIPAEVETVDFPNFLVVHQKQAELPVFEMDALEQTDKATANLPAVYGDSFLPVFDQDSHRGI